MRCDATISPDDPGHGFMKLVLTCTTLGFAFLFCVY